MFLFVRMSHKRSHRWTNYVLMISSCDDCLFAIISHLMSPYKILQIQDPECNLANLQAWQKHAKAICLLSIWHGTSCSGKWQPWPCPGKTWKLIYCALAPWYRHLPTTVWHYNICSSETLRSTSRSRQEPLSLAKVATAETTLIHIILSLIPFDFTLSKHSASARASRLLQSSAGLPQCEPSLPRNWCLDRSQASTMQIPGGK